MTLKEFFTQFFTWWNGQTLGTRFHTWRFGELVGTDEFGNRYYRRIGRPIDSNMKRAGVQIPWTMLARLALAHRRRTAERGDLRPARVGEAAPPEPHRNALGLSSARIDPRAGRPAGRDRRLRALAAGGVGRQLPRSSRPQRSGEPGPKPAGWGPG